jgi:hypothetical protein
MAPGTKNNIQSKETKEVRTRAQKRARENSVTKPATISVEGMFCLLLQYQDISSIDMLLSAKATNSNKKGKVDLALPAAFVSVGARQTSQLADLAYTAKSQGAKKKDAPKLVKGAYTASTALPLSPRG